MNNNEKSTIWYDKYITVIKCTTLWSSLVGRFNVRKSMNSIIILNQIVAVESETAGVVNIVDMS